MQIFSLSSRRGLRIRALGLLVAGLVLIYLATLLPRDMGGVDVARVFSEIGTFILAAVSVHWLFDMGPRQELMSDITQHIIENGHVATSGICDFIEDSKRIDYDEILRSPEDLVIALHHDPRFLTDHERLLKERAARGSVTKVAILKEKGSAMVFLGHGETTARALTNIQRIKEIIKRVNKQAKSPIQLFFHDNVLRYSFVMGGECVWLRFYRNSHGNHNVCGVKLNKGTPMYQFVYEDIENLFKEASTDA